MRSANTRTVLKNIAANVKARRVRLHRTQEDVAGEVGLDVRHFQRIELGQLGNVTLDVLVKLADVLDVPFTRLFRPRQLQPMKPGRPRRRAAQAARPSGNGE